MLAHIFSSTISLCFTTTGSFENHSNTAEHTFSTYRAQWQLWAGAFFASPRRGEGRGRDAHFKTLGKGEAKVDTWAGSCPPTSSSASYWTWGSEHQKSMVTRPLNSLMEGSSVVPGGGGARAITGCWTFEWAIEWLWLVLGNLQIGKDGCGVGHTWAVCHSCLWGSHWNSQSCGSLCRQSKEAGMARGWEAFGGWRWPQQPGQSAAEAAYRDLKNTQGAMVTLYWQCLW